MLRLEDLDLDMIANAMQDDRSMGAEFYLDLETGEVRIPGFDDDEDFDLEDEKYVYIDRIESYESFQHMEDFTSALPEGNVRTELERTLIRHKPFRHFKDVLGHFPKERQAWFAFKDEAMRGVIVRWLVGIEAIVDPDPDATFEGGTE